MSAHSLKIRKELQKSAEESAKFRGHKLVPWSDINDARARTSCELCDKSVFVDACPPPNGVEVCGEAVATHCSKAG